MGEWSFEIASRKKVKRFALECKGLRNCDYQQYTLTDQFLCNYGLDSLTVLCLTYVQVTEKALLYVLSNCPFLEVLSVECLDSLQNLKPSGPLVGLRNVAISTSYYAHVARILLGNVPNLVEASYAEDFTIFQISHIKKSQALESDFTGNGCQKPTWLHFSTSGISNIT
nr:hypothetical protein CFP56_52701 [Quercus suber]